MIMTSDDLFEYAESISTREGFVKFVNHLNDDYRVRHREWQNNDLGSFLGGLSGFANDMDGFYRNMGEIVDVETVTWRMAAQMLLAASVYGN